MTRHTAGKWIVTGWRIGEAKNQFEMNVTTGENIAGTLQMQENVKLVESVHGLLDALEEVVQWLEVGDHESPMYRKARAAIAKAKGEQG